MKLTLIESRSTVITPIIWPVSQIFPFITVLTCHSFKGRSSLEHANSTICTSAIRWWISDIHGVSPLITCWVRLTSLLRRWITVDILRLIFTRNAIITDDSLSFELLSSFTGLAFNRGLIILFLELASRTRWTWFVDSFKKSSCVAKRTFVGCCNIERNKRMERRTKKKWWWEMMTIHSFSRPVLFKRWLISSSSVSSQHDLILDDILHIFYTQAKIR